ncbi:MAG: hypothetical protein HZA53_01535 [Planctomycetes bacterium]|nr:hypothetical protein [Planctomycetota bacterium]
MEPTAPPSAPAALSFDKAEFEAPPPTSVACGLCQAAASNEFFRSGTLELCAACAQELREGRVARGAGSFAKALGLGVLAGIVGAGVWFAIRAATGYEIGLIGIFVGWLVGVAVQRGSGARGDWLYQTLAMVLVYLAIVSTYVPLILRELAQSEMGPAHGVGDLLLRIVLASGLSLAMPFLTATEHFIGLLILGFAVFQGWKLNKRPRYVVDGPFPIAAPEPSA